MTNTIGLIALMNIWIVALIIAVLHLSNRVKNLEEYLGINKD